jgi:preprotein translocase subunit SecF
MPNIIQKKWLWFGLSAVLIIPGIIAWSVWGMKVGVDFKSGSVIEYKGSTELTIDKVKNAIESIDLQNKIISMTGDGGFVLKTDALSDEQHQNLTNTINTNLPGTVEKSYTSVGPTIGKDQTSKAVWRVIIASLAIIFYIAFAFRKVPKPTSSWRFGVCAVVALLHDLLFVMGMFAILGHYYDFVEVDSLTVTALLTIMGFSVHDTIVVFDRIRENLRLNPGGNFETIANASVVQTIARSLNTSLTVLIVLLALFLLGGESTKGFTLALLIGITVGTYSSIFNATPLLVVWQNATKKK